VAVVLLAGHQDAGPFKNTKKHCKKQPCSTSHLLKRNTTMN
jgi:hypothetical protein